MNQLSQYYKGEKLLIMSKWKKYKLGDLGIIVTGKTPSKNNPEDWGNEMPFITPSDYKNYRKKTYSSERKLSKEGIERLNNKILPPKSILVTCIGSDMGKVVMNALPAITNQQINAIIPNNSKIDNDFLYYQLISLYKILRIYGGDGTAVPIVNKGDFETIVAEIPSLLEQKAIASVLSSLDDKIDLLHRQNKTLEAMAETLFRQWFVEEAKEDWEEGVLSDEFDFTMGQSPPGDSYNEEGIGIALFQGNADFGFRFPTNRVYTTDPKRFAEKYDTLVSVRAPVGAQNMAKAECCIGRGVATFHYKYNNSFYTYTYFKLKSLMNEIKQYNETGTVFGSISKSDFQNLGIMIPPKDEVIKFQEIAKPIDDKIIKNSVQICTLEKLRDTLLPKLMSGKVYVEMEVCNV